mgnify:CR=1 FL=1
MRRIVYNEKLKILLKICKASLWGYRVTLSSSLDKVDSPGKQHLSWSDLWLTWHELLWKAFCLCCSYQLTFQSVSCMISGVISVSLLLQWWACAKWPHGSAPSRPLANAFLWSCTWWTHPWTWITADEKVLSLLQSNKVMLIVWHS